MATNRVFESGKILRLAVASTVDSGDVVAVGDLVGVATTDYSSRDGKASIDFGGVYDVSVKGVDGNGDIAVAIGDPIYFVTGDTPELSKKTSGILFGHALEVVTSGATTTIQVRAAGHGVGSNAGGIFKSAEVTGTGSSQNTAHGLGVIPSIIFAVLTEFASNLSVDVAEGTHTSTNAVFTVTSGAKYRVIAIK